MLNMNNIYLIKSLTGAWSFLPFGAVILLGLVKHLGWGGGGGGRNFNDQEQK